MAIFNSAAGYGALTKSFHWLVTGLFSFQYIAAHIMTRLGAEDSALGASSATYYDWHKSIGIVAGIVIIARLINRLAGGLPPWAQTLTDVERAFVHRAEQLLYTGMVLMPLSGFVYVMAGGFGVRLFGIANLPDPIGSAPLLATLAKLVHIVGGWAILVALAGHIGLVLRHQVVLRDGLLRRMLPGRR